MKDFESTLQLWENLISRLFWSSLDLYISILIKQNQQGITVSNEKVDSFDENLEYIKKLHDTLSFASSCYGPLRKSKISSVLRVPRKTALEDDVDRDETCDSDTGVGTRENEAIEKMRKQVYHLDTLSDSKHLDHAEKSEYCYSPKQLEPSFQVGHKIVPEEKNSIFIKDLLSLKHDFKSLTGQRPQTVHLTYMLYSHSFGPSGNPTNNLENSGQSQEQQAQNLPNTTLNSSGTAQRNSSDELHPVVSQLFHNAAQTQSSQSRMEQNFGNFLRQPYKNQLSNHPKQVEVNPGLNEAQNSVTLNNNSTSLAPARPNSLLHQQIQLKNQPTQMNLQPSQRMNQRPWGINQPPQLMNQPVQRMNQPAQMMNEQTQMTNQTVQMMNQPAQMMDQTARIINQLAHMMNQPTKMMNQPAQTMSLQAQRRNEPVQGMNQQTQMMSQQVQSSASPSQRQRDGQWNPLPQEVGYAQRHEKQQSFKQLPCLEQLRLFQHRKVEFERIQNQQHGNMARFSHNPQCHDSLCRQGMYDCRPTSRPSQNPHRFPSFCHPTQSYYMRQSSTNGPSQLNPAAPASDTSKQRRAASSNLSSEGTSKPENPYAFEELEGEKINMPICDGRIKEYEGLCGEKVVKYIFKQAQSLMMNMIFYNTSIKMTYFLEELRGKEVPPGHGFQAWFIERIMKVFNVNPRLASAIHSSLEMKRMIAFFIGRHGLESFLLRYPAWSDKSQKELHEFAFQLERVVTLAFISKANQKDRERKRPEGAPEAPPEQDEPDFICGYHSIISYVINDTYPRTRQDVVLPPESGRIAVSSIMNHSHSGIKDKAAALKNAVFPHYVGWFSQYLVLLPIASDSASHQAVSQLIREIDIPSFPELVMKEVIFNIKYFFQNGVSRSPQQLERLQNWGRWLGMQTIAKGEPQKLDVNLKELLFEAYYMDLTELRFVLSFIVSMIFASAHEPLDTPSPWTVSLLNVLNELREDPKIPPNLKVDVGLDALFDKYRAANIDYQKHDLFKDQDRVAKLKIWLLPEEAEQDFDIKLEEKPDMKKVLPLQPRRILSSNLYHYLAQEGQKAFARTFPPAHNGLVYGMKCLPQNSAHVNQKNSSGQGSTAGQDEQRSLTSQITRNGLETTDEKERSVTDNPGRGTAASIAKKSGDKNNDTSMPVVKEMNFVEALCKSNYQSPPNKTPSNDTERRRRPSSEDPQSIGTQQSRNNSTGSNSFTEVTQMNEKLEWDTEKGLWIGVVQDMSCSLGSLLWGTVLGEINIRSTMVSPEFFLLSQESDEENSNSSEMRDTEMEEEEEFPQFEKVKECITRESSEKSFNPCPCAEDRQRQLIMQANLFREEVAEGNWLKFLSCKQEIKILWSNQREEDEAKEKLSEKFTPLFSKWDDLLLHENKIKYYKSEMSPENSICPSGNQPNESLSQINKEVNGESQGETVEALVNEKHSQLPQINLDGKITPTQSSQQSAYLTDCKLYELFPQMDQGEVLYPYNLQGTLDFLVGEPTEKLEEMNHIGENIAQKGPQDRDGSLAVNQDGELLLLNENEQNMLKEITQAANPPVVKENEELSFLRKYEENVTNESLHESVNELADNQNEEFQLSNEYKGNTDTKSPHDIIGPPEAEENNEVPMLNKYEENIAKLSLYEPVGPVAVKQNEEFKLSNKYEVKENPHKLKGSSAAPENSEFPPPNEIEKNTAKGSLHESVDPPIGNQNDEVSPLEKYEKNAALESPHKSIYHPANEQNEEHSLSKKHEEKIAKESPPQSIDLPAKVLDEEHSLSKKQEENKAKESPPESIDHSADELDKEHSLSKKQEENIAKESLDESIDHPANELDEEHSLSKKHEENTTKESPHESIDHPANELDEEHSLSKKHEENTTKESPHESIDHPANELDEEHSPSKKHEENTAKQSPHESVDHPANELDEEHSLSKKDEENTAKESPHESIDHPANELDEEHSLSKKHEHPANEQDEEYSLSKKHEENIIKESPPESIDHSADEQDEEHSLSKKHEENIIKESLHESIDHPANELDEEHSLSKKHEEENTAKESLHELVTQLANELDEEHSLSKKHEENTAKESPHESIDHPANELEEEHSLSKNQEENTAKESPHESIDHPANELDEHYSLSKNQEKNTAKESPRESVDHPTNELDEEHSLSKNQEENTARESPDESVDHPANELDEEHSLSKNQEENTAKESPYVSVDHPTNELDEEHFLSKKPEENIAKESLHESIDHSANELDEEHSLSKKHQENTARESPHESFQSFADDDDENQLTGENGFKEDKCNGITQEPVDSVYKQDEQEMPTLPITISENPLTIVQHLTVDQKSVDKNATTKSEEMEDACTGLAGNFQKLCPDADIVQDKNDERSIVTISPTNSWNHYKDFETIRNEIKHDGVIDETDVFQSDNDSVKGNSENDTSNNTDIPKERDGEIVKSNGKSQQKWHNSRKKKSKKKKKKSNKNVTKTEKGNALKANENAMKPERNINGENFSPCAVLDESNQAPTNMGKENISPKSITAIPNTSTDEKNVIEETTMEESVSFQQNSNQIDKSPSKENVDVKLDSSHKAVEQCREIEKASLGSKLNNGKDSSEIDDEKNAQTCKTEETDLNRIPLNDSTDEGQWEMMKMKGDSKMSKNILPKPSECDVPTAKDGNIPCVNLGFDNLSAEQVDTAFKQLLNDMSFLELKDGDVRPQDTLDLFFRFIEDRQLGLKPQCCDNKSEQGPYCKCRDKLKECLDEVQRATEDTDGAEICRRFIKMAGRVTSVEELIIEIVCNLLRLFIYPGVTDVSLEKKYCKYEVATRITGLLINHEIQVPCPVACDRDLDGSECDSASTSGNNGSSMTSPTGESQGGSANDKIGCTPGLMEDGKAVRSVSVSSNQFVLSLKEHVKKSYYERKNAENFSQGHNSASTDEITFTQCTDSERVKMMMNIMNEWTETYESSLSEANKPLISCSTPIIQQFGDDWKGVEMKVSESEHEFPELDALGHFAGTVVLLTEEEETVKEFIFQIFTVIRTLMMRNHDSDIDDFHPLLYYRIISLFLETMSCAATRRKTDKDFFMWQYCCFLMETLPEKAPKFAYMWAFLLNRTSFRNYLTSPTRDRQLWDIYAELLNELFLQVALGMEYNMDVNLWEHYFQAGTMSVIHLRDSMPQFLCLHSTFFCCVLSSCCEHLRKVILCASPPKLSVPDPSSVKFDINKAVNYELDFFMELLFEKQFYKFPEKIETDLISYLERGTPKTITNRLKGLMMNTQNRKGKHGYRLAIMNTLTYTVGCHAVTQIFAKQSNAPDVCPHLAFFQKLLKDLKGEGALMLLITMMNQLRYPSSLTIYFGVLVITLFRCSDVFVKELIIRAMSERFILEPPYPWGILWTVGHMMKNRDFALNERNLDGCKNEITRIKQKFKESTLSSAPSRGKRGFTKDRSAIKVVKKSKK